LSPSDEAGETDDPVKDDKDKENCFFELFAEEEVEKN
jgi:hypothetical protein